MVLIPWATQSGAVAPLNHTGGPCPPQPPTSTCGQSPIADVSDKAAFAGLASANMCCGRRSEKWM